MIEFAVLEEAKRIKQDYPEKNKDEIIKILKSMIRPIIMGGVLSEAEESGSIDNLFEEIAVSD